MIYRTKEPGTPGEVFLDPNTLSDDGTVALAAMSFSKDGRWFAYSAAASGSDWVEIRVMDTADKSLAADRIEWVKFSGARWAPDSKGFYYSAYDAPKKSAYSSKNEFQKVYYHELGTPQSADKLVYEDKAHPLRYFSAGLPTTASGSSSWRPRVRRERKFFIRRYRTRNSAFCCRASRRIIRPSTARTTGCST